MKSLSLGALAGALLLAGCQPQLTVGEICRQDPQMCQDLNRDGWCRQSRAEVIRARHQEANSDDPLFLYDQLVALEEYVDCMGHVSRIVNTSPAKPREQERNRYYLAGLASLEALQQATQGHSSPALSLYHWTRFNDGPALERFLEAEAQGQLAATRLKRLAGIYFSAEQPQKAREYLLEVIEADPAGARLDEQLLLELGFTLERLGQREAAYLFSYLGQQRLAQGGAGALAGHLGIGSRQAAELRQQAVLLDEAMADDSFDRESLNL
ncbi:DUF2989 domain-containing protein [Ferrimonas balearica]|uniref:DUF2989 domain-containing protein n=1 Tax=Ferrimonas balearica TaxID=44012 RepID=UPI001C996980|nr:DUF2989 domain-containing protein [Ferrimonas balearica]MBY5991665.1 DUF2989 domain-containing protein [Ferrimonas balearica]